MRRIRSRLPKPPKAITCIASRSSFVPPSCARVSARPKPLGSAASFHRIENNGCLCVGRWSDEECGLRPYPLRLSKLGVNRVVFLEALLKPDSPAIITLAGAMGDPLRTSGHDAIPIDVGRHVWIARSVMLLPGVTIDNGAAIGANAVVTHSVPKGNIVVGVPAKPLPWRKSK